MFGPEAAPWPWLQLGILGVATSALSAVVGLAGGVFLLAALLLWLEPAVAIPVHGVAQLASNASRAHLQRQHVRWDVLGPYLVLLLPGGVLGLAVLSSIPPQLGRAAIALFALTATWLPTWFRLGPPRSHSALRRRFLWAGALCGVANMTFGATGPLMAPFVLSLQIERRPSVGTLAICQAAGHLMKVLVFAAAGFSFADYVPALALLCPAVILGSFLGTRVLHYLPERAFVWAVRGAVTAVALRLLWGVARAGL